MDQARHRESQHFRYCENFWRCVLQRSHFPKPFIIILRIQRAFDRLKSVFTDLDFSPKLHLVHVLGPSYYYYRLLGWVHVVSTKQNTTFMKITIYFCYKQLLKLLQLLYNSCDILTCLFSQTLLFNVYHLLRTSRNKLLHKHLLSMLSTKITYSCFYNTTPTAQ